MKLLTAIKKAKQKAEERHGDAVFFVKIKYGSRYRHSIIVSDDNIDINGWFEIDDLLSTDWIIEEMWQDDWR